MFPRLAAILSAMNLPVLFHYFEENSFRKFRPFKLTDNYPRVVAILAFIECQVTEGRLSLPFLLGVKRVIAFSPLT